jgi:hypothetical protein
MRRYAVIAARLRCLSTAGVLALSVLAGSLGAASPASAQTVRNFSASNAAIARAIWFTFSTTSFTETTVIVSKSRQGSELFIHQFTGNLDANGNLTGGTETFATGTSGFSFAIDQRLTTASLSGSGPWPGLTCTLDANGNQIGCNPTTFTGGVAADWTGQGPISRSQSTTHVKEPGFNELLHDNGTFRFATATGTVDGVPLGATESFTSLATDDSVFVVICIGTSC